MCFVHTWDELILSLSSSVILASSDGVKHRKRLLVEKLLTFTKLKAHPRNQCQWIQWWVKWTITLQQHWLVCSVFPGSHQWSDSTGEWHLTKVIKKFSCKPHEFILFSFWWLHNRLVDSVTDNLEFWIQSTYISVKALNTLHTAAFMLHCHCFGSAATKATKTSGWVLHSFTVSFSGFESLACLIKG